MEPVLGDEARGPGREAQLRLESFRDPCEVSLRVLFESTAAVYIGKISSQDFDPFTVGTSALKAE